MSKKAKHLCPEPYCSRVKGKKKACCDKHHYINQKEKDPVKHTFGVLKRNAKRRGKIFTITLEYFKEFLKDKPYMNEKGRFSESLHIDRDKEYLGYIPGNLTIKTNADNRKKYVEYHKNKKQEEGDIIVGNMEEVDF
jgi:hypothetical protein